MQSLPSVKTCWVGITGWLWHLIAQHLSAFKGVLGGGVPNIQPEFFFEEFMRIYFQTHLPTSPSPQSTLKTQTMSTETLEYGSPKNLPNSKVAPLSPSPLLPTALAWLKRHTSQGSQDPPQLLMISTLLSWGCSTAQRGTRWELGTCSPPNQALVQPLPSQSTLSFHQWRLSPQRYTTGHTYIMCVTRKAASYQNSQAELDLMLFIFLSILKE